MAVQVQDEFNRVFLLDAFYLFLDVTDFGQSVNVLSIPASIQIETLRVTPIVPQLNPVHIHYWDAVHVESPKQKLGLRAGSVHLCQNLIHDVGAHCLPRVLPSHDHHSLFIRVRVLL